MAHTVGHVTSYTTKINVIDQCLDYVCGAFRTGDNGDLQSATEDLKNNNQTYNIPGESCKRVWCWNTSGVYVGAPFLAPQPALVLIP